jgi:DUF917 family protein
MNLDDLAEGWEILQAVGGGVPHPGQYRVHARLKDIYRVQVITPNAPFKVPKGS